MTSEVDLPEFVRGDTWTHKFTVVDDNQAAVDVAGWTFWMTLKLDPTVADTAADAQVSVVAPAGADATNGIAYVTFAPADTLGLTPASYHYDAQYKTSGGAIQTVVYGKVPVLRGVTQDS